MVMKHDTAFVIYYGHNKSNMLWLQLKLQQLIVKIKKIDNYMIL